MSDFKMTKRAFPNLQIWAKPYKIVRTNKIITWILTKIGAMA